MSMPQIGAIVERMALSLELVFRLGYDMAKRFFPGFAQEHSQEFNIDVNH
jgi:hypothetical protein